MTDGDAHWQRERRRRRLAHRDTFRREWRALTRRTEPDWRTEPAMWVIWKSNQLQQALPPKLRAHVTMSAGIVRMPTGDLRPVISRSGESHALEKALYALRGEADIAHDGYDENGEHIVQRDQSVHAEVRMLEHAEREGGTLIMAAAGRPVCEECVNQLDISNVRIESKLHKPFQDRPHLNPDLAPPSQSALDSTQPVDDRPSTRANDPRPYQPPRPPLKPPDWPPPNPSRPNQPGQGGKRRGPRQ